jgi:hypothetical protein
MLRRGREDPECCFGSMMIEHTEKGVGEDFWMVRSLAMMPLL